MAGSSTTDITTARCEAYETLTMFERQVPECQLEYDAEEQQDYENDTSQNYSYVPILRNPTYVPALQNPDNVPTLQNPAYMSTLQNSDCVPTLQNPAYMPTLPVCGRMEEA